MRFTRIQLENWRNFAAMNVPLQNRLFIVGANASGKSNLLDALRFLNELVIPGGGFQRAVARRGGVSSIRNLAARGPVTDVVVDIEFIADDDHLWRYRLGFNKKSSSAPPTLAAEKVWQDGKVIIDRPDDADLADPARLSQTVLEQTFANQSFRVIADFFTSIYYFHLVPQLVRDTERYVARETDPYGGDFLEQMADVNQNIQRARLRRINNALQIAVPQLSNLEIKREDNGVPHLRAQYEHWRPKGKWQDERDFSDGTLRLIGLLWALQTGDGPLLLEEPELSLHPAVVRHIPAMMQSVLRERKKAVRQVFISTHSQDLLTDEGIDANEVLLLAPSTDGTVASIGAEQIEIQQQLAAGVPLAEIVTSQTAPNQPEQLALW